MNLSFDFAPKLILIEGQGGVLSPGEHSALVTAIGVYGSNITYQIVRSTTSGTYGGGLTELVTSWESKSISWYSDAGSNRAMERSVQLNESNEVYRWFAIG